MYFDILLLCLCVFAKLANSQNQVDVEGCIADNITLDFKPAIDPSRTVKSYTWNKDIGPNRDPSFAKYEPSGDVFETYMDDIKGRLLHSPEKPTTLDFINLRESDTAKYTLVVRYVIFTGESPEYIVNLSIQDLCFKEPRPVDTCTITTCFSGKNGSLLIPNDEEVMVDGFREVTVCDDLKTGNYSCCNLDGRCKTLFLNPPEKVEELTTAKGKNQDGTNNSTGLKKQENLLLVALLILLKLSVDKL